MPRYKLVRNKTPDLIKEGGFAKHGYKLTNERVQGLELESFLRYKLLEESLEVWDSKNIDNLIEEMADVLELLYCIADANDISIKKIQEVRIQKRTDHGSFTEGRLLEISDESV